MLKIDLSKEGLKKILFRYVFGVGVGIEFILSIGVYILFLLNVPTQNGDNVEHIHSSFLVAMGNVPYKDFFQHHNPLLWYIFAPIVNMFKFDSTVSEIVCFISFLVFLKSLVYVYKIGVEFLGSKLVGVFAVLGVIIPSYKIFAVDFRPDNYMVFCLMGCLYYYFSYLRDKKVLFLSVAFGYAVLAFLFAQKAIFFLFGLGLSGIYFIYKKEVLGKDVLKSMSVVILGGGVFFGWLWAHDMVKLYYVCNYLFNLNLAEGFELNRVVMISFHIKIWLWLSWLMVLVNLFNRGNMYLNVVGFLFVSEFFQRVLYFSPYSYYYWLLLYIASLYGSVFLVKLDGYNRLARMVMLGVLGVILYNSIVFQLVEIKKAIERNLYLPDYITRKITPCDYVFNGDGLMYNIFGKDPHYYWQLIGQLDVIGEKTGIVEKPDINKLIEYYKPRFVYGKSYFNKFANESGRKEIVHYVDMDLINKYYNQSPFANVYELKKEYVKACPLKAR